MTTRPFANLPVPPALTRAWDRGSPREHRFIIAAVVAVCAAAAWAWIWQPIQSDTERVRRDLARDRALLAVARAQIDDMAGLKRIAPATGDPRAAIERVLGERALKANLTSLEVKDNRTVITFAAIGFDALVGMLDALARTDGLRPVAVTLTARVEPGTVRAEVTLAR